MFKSDNIYIEDLFTLMIAFCYLCVYFSDLCVIIGYIC